MSENTRSLVPPVIGNTRKGGIPVSVFIGVGAFVFLALLLFVLSGALGGGGNSFQNPLPTQSLDSNTAQMRSYIDDVIQKHGSEKLTAADNQALLLLDDQLQLGNSVSLQEVNSVLRSIGVSDDVMTSVMNSYTPEIQLLLKDPAKLIPAD